MKITIIAGAIQFHKKSHQSYKKAIENDKLTENPHLD
jgi:hypothetical protein